MQVIASNTLSHSSESAHSVHGAVVTASSTDVKSSTAAPASVMCVSLSLVFYHIFLP